MINLGGMSTETRNERTMNLDAMPVDELLRVMNDEDARVAEAIRQALPQIEEAVHRVVASFRTGGRLIYMGAGTSGRLGVLDAAECVPTFGVPPTMVVGLIAGGPGALISAVEGAEDDAALGASDLKAIDLSSRDTVVGIAASGRTPYVLGGLEYAGKIGASTVSVVCNKGSALSKAADVAIEVVPGPEVLTGSTRLKAGTAQKMVLNMISTASMIGIGKVYKNLMVDREAAQKALTEAGDSCRVAIVMLLLSCGRDEALQKLENAEGRIRGAVSESKSRA